MSTTAFGLGSKYFALYEVAGVGIQWRTINQSPVEGDDFNLLLSVVMLIIDAIVYGVLTWYIEAVHPGKLLHYHYLVWDDNISSFKVIFTRDTKYWIFADIIHAYIPTHFSQKSIPI